MHVRVRESLHYLQRLEPAVLEYCDAGPRSNPQAPGTVDEQDGNVLAGDCGFAATVEHREPDPIEARQSFLGTDPQVAVRRSRDRLNGGLRQSLRNLPIVENVLARLQRRFESRRR